MADWVQRRFYSRADSLSINRTQTAFSEIRHKRIKTLLHFCIGRQTGMYGPPPCRKRKVRVTSWSAQMHTAFVGAILQMAIRTSILGNVRDSQPSPRELPEVPKFHSGQPVDRKTLFTASLKELAGEVVTDPPADLTNS